MMCGEVPVPLGWMVCPDGCIRVALPDVRFRPFLTIVISLPASIDPYPDNVMSAIDVRSAHVQSKRQSLWRQAPEINKIVPLFSRRALSPRFITVTDTGFSFHGSIRLHHASAEQSCAAEAGNFEKYLPVVFPRRQDRCTGLERFGQIHTVENHGRCRH